jgi:hypothetical protein
MDVLDRDLLLTLAAVAIETIDKEPEGSRKLVSDGSQYSGPVTLSGTKSSDFSLLSNRGPVARCRAVGRSHTVA